MKFVYSPEGGTRQEWDFEPLKFMSTELEVVERRTGMPYDAWVAAMRESSVIATHGLLFLYLKRGNPTTRWEDVTFSLCEVGFEFDDEDAPADDETAVPEDDAGGKDPE